jgi:hypothetical protein
MNWRLFTWKDWLGVLLGVIIVGGVAWTYVLPARIEPGPARGFGPDWVCHTPGPGYDPVCVKKAPGSKGAGQP